MQKMSGVIVNLLTFWVWINDVLLKYYHRFFISIN